MFVNLSDYRDQMLAVRVAGRRPDAKDVAVDGSLPGPVLQRMNPDWRRSGPLFNFRTDYLEKYDLAAPTSFDELYDVLVTIHAAEPDLIMVTNRSSSSSGTRSFWPWPIHWLR